MADKPEFVIGWCYVKQPDQPSKKWLSHIYEDGTFAWAEEKRHDLAVVFDSPEDAAWAIYRRERFYSGKPKVETSRGNIVIFERVPVRPDPYDYHEATLSYD
jgi:hypothetical protein